MDSTSKKEKFIKIVLICTIIFLVLLTVWIINNRTKTSHVENKSIAEITFDLLKDKHIGLEKGYWYYVLYMRDFTSNYSFLKYVDQVSREKFSEEKLKFIIFSTSRGDKPGLSNTPKQGQILFYSGIDTIAPLEGPQMSSIPKRCICVIDPSGNVSFTAGFLKENDIRLLLEKSFREKKGVSEKIENTLKPGDLFGPFHATNIATFQQVEVDEKISPRTWIIFTSNCVSCALKSNLVSYKEIEPTLWGKLQIPVALLFSPYFRLEEVDLKAKSLNISNEIFLANDELKGIENSLNKSSDSTQNVIVIITDSQNKIIYREPFQVFLGHIDGGYFEKKRQH